MSLFTDGYVKIRMMSKTFVKKVFLVIAALLGTLSFLYLNSIAIDNVFICITVFAGMLFLFTLLKGEKKASTVILSIILALLLTLGKYPIYIVESYGMELILKLIITLTGSFLFFNSFFPYLFDRLDAYEFSDRKPLSLTLVFFVSFIVILGAWIPAWLAEYPGIFTPDTVTQLHQAQGLYPYNNMNPFIHTVILKGLYLLISLFNKDVNTVYFVIGLLQMIFTAFVFAYAIAFIYERSKSLLLACGSLLFFALSSFNVFYNITISKDTVYAAFALLLAIAIDNYCNAPIKRNAVTFIITAVMYCLLRENGFYSFILTFVFLLFMAIKRNFKKTVLLFLITLILTGVIKYPVMGTLINTVNSYRRTAVFKVNDYVDLDEGLFIADLEDIEYRRDENDYTDKDYFRGSFLYVMAFQQVANVVCHDRPLTAKEEEMIEELIPIVVIKKVYDPMLVDPIFEAGSKYGTPKAVETGAFEYFKLWASLLVKYPQDYIEAYVNMTRYYFYPNRYVKMYYIGVFENKLGIKEDSIVSEDFREGLESFYEGQKDIPLVASIYSPGTVSFILLIAVFYLIRKNNYTPLLSLLPLLGNFLILMACVPINDEFRYMYPIVVCLPFILMQMIVKGDEYSFEIEGGNRKWI